MLQCSCHWVSHYRLSVAMLPVSLGLLQSFVCSYAARVIGSLAISRV